MLYSRHRRRIYTEEMAKVVAAVWGVELIRFLTALAILQQDYMKIKDEVQDEEKDEYVLVFPSSCCKISSTAMR